MGVTNSTINLFTIEHQIPQSKILKVFKNWERLSVRRKSDISSYSKNDRSCQMVEEDNKRHIWRYMVHRGRCQEKQDFFLPRFHGSTKKMKISKNPKSFPRSRRVADTLKSLSGHSFPPCETIPANFMARDSLCKWNCLRKMYCEEITFFKSRKFSHIQ